MIIKSLFKHTIGDLVVDCFITDANGDSHQLPFLILREVSKDDYLNYWNEHNGVIGKIFNDDRFYEISID